MWLYNHIAYSCTGYGEIKLFYRFFWNRAMISELLNHLKLEEVLPWITPLIQGFVQIDRLAIQV